MSLKDRLNSQLKTVMDNELVKSKFQESLKNPEDTAQKLEGLGILDAFFVDENLNSVYVSGAKNIYVEKKGVVHKSNSTFRDNVQLINLIKKNASDSGIEYDENTPYMQFNYKKGVNVRAVLPPLSSVPVLFVKNYCDNNANLKVLQENLAVSKELAMVLETFAAAKLNILIAGAPQSLKTTLLSTIAKNMPITNKGAVIDFKNEISVDLDNFVNYDFTGIKDEELRGEILSSIFNSNPDKIVVNDCDDSMFYQMLTFASYGFKGLLTSVNAADTSDAIFNVAQIILKRNPGMNFEEAKRSVYKMFDIIIFVNKDENGLRAVSKISETDSNECKINDIFYLNENKEHLSSGFVPKFYVESTSLSINPNIFDENYKHTYAKVNTNDFKPSDEFIRKIRDNSSPDSFESISRSLSSDEMIKRAQEKFEEFKKNANATGLQGEQPNEEYWQEQQNNEFNLNG